MKFITFQKPNLYHLFFIIYFVTIMIKQTLESNIFEENLISVKFFQMYSNILSHILSIIPFLIIKYRSKSNDKSQEKYNSENALQLIHNNLIKTYKGENVIKYTFLTSFFYFLSEAIICIFLFINNIPELYSSYSLYIYSILNCVVLYITSYFILKTTFYKHHYLSFIINLICVLIDLIIDITQIIQQRITNYMYYIYIIVILFKLTFLCIFDNYAKLAMHSAFLSPNSLLLNMSIYEIFFLIIFSLPFIFITVEDFDGINDIIFKGFLKYLTGNKLIYSIIYFINNFFLELFLLYIIDKFSPSHIALAISLNPFCLNLFYMFHYLIKGEVVYWYRFINFFIFLLVIIGSMIHNEIFIINKWGLNKKTKLYLNKEFNAESIDPEGIDSDTYLDSNEEKKENETEIELISNS